MACVRHFEPLQQILKIFIAKTLVWKYFIVQLVGS